ncbi:MAG: tetratricopeptide repeat protein, partial [Cyanobacteria bacterium J06559_3]
MVTVSSVLPIDSHILPGHNQETYQRLQGYLQATPPYQLWIAVCDDLPLQRQLAATLEEGLQVEAEIASTQFVFSPDNPDLVEQIQTWAASVSRKPPLLQILGIEQLTYRSSDQQYQFLRSLRGVLPAWQQLGCSLLIWMPRPWLKKVKRAAPALCQTVFQFMGEPTPLSTVAADPQYQAVFSPIRQWQFLKESVSLTETEPQKLESASEAAPAKAATPQSVTGKSAADTENTSDLGAEIPTFSEELWHRLEADLTQLEDGQKTLLPPPATEAETPAQAHHERPSRMPAAADPDAVDLDAVMPSVVVAEERPPVAVTQVSRAEAQQFEREISKAYELRDRIQAGDHSLPSLQAAIQQYEQVLSHGAATHQRTEILNDLGSLYWLAAQQATDVETYQRSLIHSCDLYEAALNPVSPDTGNEILTRIHSNLGSVYSLLAAYQDPPQCLDKAVRSFHRALQYTPVERAATEYATLQTHLGTAYWTLAQHTQDADHLHRAIAAYQEALQHSHPQRMPQAHAQLQNNLGIALWSLSRHERPAFLLKHAIDAYRGALAYRTLESDPVGCAATHNNLGTAYWDLGGHCQERSETQRQVWQQAITAYETALLAAAQVPPGALGFDPWATHHSVGVVYDQLAIALAPDSVAQQPLLEKAISHYVKALNG